MKYPIVKYELSFEEKYRKHKDAFSRSELSYPFSVPEVLAAAAVVVAFACMAYLIQKVIDTHKEEKYKFTCANRRVSYAPQCNFIGRGGEE